MEKLKAPKLQTKKTDRIETLDVAKGLGILFVVFAHVNYTPSVLTCIYAFHMPLFFLLAGMVFKKEKHPAFVPFLKRRIKTLLCPYVFFYIASVLLRFITMVPGGITPDDKARLMKYVLQMFLSQGSAGMANAPLWFIPCLLVVEILYFFIAKMRKMYRVPTCLLLVFLGWLLESGLFEFRNALLPWSIDSALFALGFYAIGNMMAPRIFDAVKKAEKSGSKKWGALGALVLSGALMIPLSFLNGKITLGSKILHNGFLLYATGILGTIGILGAAVLLNKSRFLKFCGENSFYIMASHYMVRVFLCLGLQILGLPLYDDKIFVQTLVPFLVVLAVSVAFTVVYVNVKKRIIK